MLELKKSSCKSATLLCARCRKNLNEFPHFTAIHCTNLSKEEDTNFCPECAEALKIESPDTTVKDLEHLFVAYPSAKKLRKMMSSNSNMSSYFNARKSTITEKTRARRKVH